MGGSLRLHAIGWISSKGAELLKVGLAVALALALVAPASGPAIAATKPPEDHGLGEISGYWRPLVRQWSPRVVTYAAKFGVDPEFVAAIIENESRGDPTLRSRVGAVGPMQIMPFESGIVTRPKESILAIPSVNIAWGAALLADILRQSGGNAFMAAEAYAGGWGMVGSKVTRQYASEVLSDYAQAVAWKNGVILDPDNPSWSVVVTGLDGRGRSVLRVVRGNITELDAYPSIEDLYANMPGLRLAAVTTVGQVANLGDEHRVTGLMYLFLPPSPTAVSTAIEVSR